MLRVSQSYIRLTNATGNDYYQHWGGSNTAVFLANGLLAIKINLSLLPTNGTWEVTDWTSWTGQFTATLQFPDIEIAFGQVVQQQRNEDTTLSLTFVVLFIASLDIGVVLYDHSEDKDPDKQYEYRQRKEKRKRRYQREERLETV